MQQDYDESFQQTWREYPARQGGNSKKAAYKAWKAAFDGKGVTFELAQAIHDGVMRYAEYLRQTGKIGTEYVKQGSTFFNQEGWLEPWAARPTVVENPEQCWWEDETGRHWPNRELTPRERSERDEYLRTRQRQFASG